MNYFEVLLLSLIQGITEFFPISSSTHLKFAKILLGIPNEVSQTLFDVFCHAGTLLAVILFFRKDIVTMFFKERKKLYLLMVATLPLLPAYIFIRRFLDTDYAPKFLGIFLTLTSLMLFAGQSLRWKRKECSSFKRQIYDVLWIGAMQSSALIPGISRSASTISIARVLGWSATDAVRFSFLLSIPTILGGLLVEMFKLTHYEGVAISQNLHLYSMGFLISGGVGYFTIHKAMKILEKGNLRPFAWYCLGAGVAVFIYLNFFHS